ncbi:hypothetical protein [Paracoccus seriniphilus]|uniref:Leucyl aminopeptidase (Aminopeptidase T) n=1 Tax=Paracoccus seriniphilus TaxID=184748 RepID=A0A239Q2Y7_9RHOB|nr:hypothetical protein [Paracoccus seriniphilus]WCR16183.1 hypothetical protein JHW44_17240 [Paracoccus seriniphilus]SNT76552.1 hypothetical protein SAMN05444959_12150 [Paracoccus seriniphilus]
MPCNVEKGAENLLRNCAGTGRNDQVLILHEPENLGYYDREIVTAVATVARRLGARVSLHEVPFDPIATSLPDSLTDMMRAADQTVFLARIGDQLRFTDIGAHGQAVISYALDAEMLGSAYGTADYHGFDALKSALNSMLGKAEIIHATCPNGTEFTGAGPGSAVPPQDVGLRRFPMPVFMPLPAAGFSGRVALPGFLVGTGSKYYTPYMMEYEGTLFAEFDAGRITGFSGDSEAITAAQKHYDHVAKLFDIDRDFVHSWHVGIHPGCGFAAPATDDFMRWSGAAFGNPRLLHFHTCGAYAPGEISWNVVDPTIVVDGVTLWKDGVLDPDAVPGGSEILAAYPSLRATFAQPDRRIGL